MVRVLDEIRGFGSQQAFRVLDGENSYDVSYEQYYSEVEQCAYNLQNIVGDLKGKRIGIYCSSNYEYTVMLIAMIFGRAVAVPFNFRESVDNITYQIDNADLDYLVIDNDNLSGENIAVKTIAKADLLEKNGGRIQLSDFCDDEKDQTALMIYTSGTTGKSKGVVLTAGNLFEDKKNMYDDHAPFDTFDGLRVYTNFPFYHIGGITGILSHFEYGCVTYISMNPGNVINDLENETIDSAVVIPATLNLWKKSVVRGHIERLGGVRLLVSAGAPPDLSTVELFMEHGISYGQYYGMSETSGNITLNFDCKDHLRSVGKPDPNVEVVIIDGEICVKGSSVMREYYKNPEETANTVIDGILHTGDLGRIDDDGYVYITGRKKNLIILSGGENISPEELERELYKCAFIYECKVFAENDRLCATVYTDQEHTEEVADYITELNTRLPIFKRIYKKNIQTEPLEKTSTGKIKR